MSLKQQLQNIYEKRKEEDKHFEKVEKIKKELLDAAKYANTYTISEFTCLVGGIGEAHYFKKLCEEKLGLVVTLQEDFSVQAGDQIIIDFEQGEGWPEGSFPRSLWDARIKELNKDFLEEQASESEILNLLERLAKRGTSSISMDGIEREVNSPNFNTKECIEELGLDTFYSGDRLFVRIGADK